ncbi:hemolysin family protein [Aerosakkonemataceae cyanobacterium BLCC-F154]|uniref:Hemolysin family protein n=1 Tax=Floridaenema fluviatile BLCC-F154 TaxID=3153640 RepID=A0ABV4YJD7_9CYAN
MSLTTDFLIILLLIVSNGFLVMSEMAIVSSRKIRLQQMATQDRKAQLALSLANAPNRFLPTVQIGITLLSIISGAFGETTISRYLRPILANIPFLRTSGEAIASVLAILIITYLTLIIGELVPKRMALNSPESIAAIVAMPMRFLSIIAAPLVYFLGTSTQLVIRILGITPSTEPEVTEEEIKVLIEQGTEAGTFEEAEQDMVERVFRLGDRPVSALMTPRPEIVWLNIEDSAEVTRQKLVSSQHSRFPVCQRELDNVLGVLQVNDILSRCLNSEPLDLTASLRRPLFVPESTRGLKVLEMFKQTGTHIVFVVDEYAVIQGLVTLNDILVEIVGDIPSVYHTDEPLVVQRDDGSWLIDGMLSVDEFLEMFEIEELTPQERGSYNTMGGLIMSHLGRIPTATDKFDWKGFCFEVVDMDGNRVDKILVVPSDNKDSQESTNPLLE